MARLLEREPEPEPTCHTGLEIYPLLIAEDAELFDQRWAAACEHVRAQFRERCEWRGMRPRWAWRIAAQ